MKKPLTFVSLIGILFERAFGVHCDEAGDCSQSEVTFVEYVRYPAYVPGAQSGG